jgi:DNA helicase HerA-like ATPase
MRALIGYNGYDLKQGKQTPVVWDVSRVINPHILVLGSSGTGKSYTIRRMVRDMARTAPRGARIHIFDVHGDLDVDGASSARFSQATRYGYNPLVIDPDPEFGGVSRRIGDFIEQLERTTGALGNRQEAVLRRLLEDLFAANGMFVDNAASWSRGRKQPTFVDALRFGENKVKALFLGTSSKAAVLLEQVNRAARQMVSTQRAAAKDRIGETGKFEKLKEQFERAKVEARDAFVAHLESVQFGREFDDILRYDSVEVLKSVLDRLRNLASAGVFEANPPPFSAASPVWRYDVQALADPVQRLLVFTRAEELFREAVQAGVTDQIRTIIVLDEAHKFLDESAGNIIGRIAKEGRKFGCALVAASQSVDHFGADFLMNCATKIVLGLDPLVWGAAIRQLRIDERLLQYLTPKRSCAVQMRRPGECGSKFFEVALGNGGATQAAA